MESIFYEIMDLYSKLSNSDETWTDEVLEKDFKIYDEINSKKNKMKEYINKYKLESIEVKKEYLLLIS